MYIKNKWLNMCHLFFTTDPPKKMVMYMLDFFKYTLRRIAPEDKFTGIGIVMKKWSKTRREPVWYGFRELEKNLTRRTEDRIEYEIKDKNTSAFGAHVRICIHDSPDRFPYDEVHYGNVDVLQPILYKDDYSMLFKGHVVGFPRPEVHQRIYDRIVLNTHKLFTNDLSLLSDVSYVFFLILAFIYEDYIANTPRATVQENEANDVKVPPSEERAMLGITNAIAWFKEAGIELVAHIVLMTPHFAVVVAHNAPEWFVNKDEPVTMFSTNGLFDNAERHTEDAMFVMPINDAGLNRLEEPFAADHGKAVPTPDTRVDAIASIPRIGRENAWSAMPTPPHMSSRPPRPPSNKASV
jgi:hypothetical protein